MRSSEVARLAGVTVRTLRHYHQVGVLPEPARGSNGYRDYDLGTVALLLRVRRLVDLGVPLHRVGDLLGDRPTDDALDAIDAELATTIEQLQEKRAQIARLREVGGRADLPEEVAGLVALGPARPGLLGDLDRDVLLYLLRLVGHGPGQRDLLRDLEETLRATHDDAPTRRATDRFEALPPDASDGAVEGAATELAAVLAPFLEHFASSATSRAMAGVRPDLLPDVAADRRLNAAQRRAWERLGELLEGHVAAAEDG